MVEHSTTITIPSELIERADQAYDAVLDAHLAAARRSGSAEHERVLADKCRELAEIYRELGGRCVISGGLWRGMRLAAEQLDRQARTEESRLAMIEQAKGGDRG